MGRTWLYRNERLHGADSRDRHLPRSPSRVSNTCLPTTLATTGAEAELSQYYRQYSEPSLNVISVNISEVPQDERPFVPLQQERDRSGLG